MFSARRRARATPAAAIPRRPAAAAAPRGPGVAARPRSGPSAGVPRSGLPAPPAGLRGGGVVWWRGGGGAARSAQRTKWKEPRRRRRRVTSSARSLRHGGRSRRRRRVGRASPRWPGLMAAGSGGGAGTRAGGRALCPGLRAAAGSGGCLPPAGSRSRSPGGRLPGVCSPPAGCQPSRERETFTACSPTTGASSLPRSPTRGRSFRGLAKFFAAAFPRPPGKHPKWREGAF